MFKLQESNVTLKNKILAGVIATLVVLFLALSTKIFVTLDAGSVMVIQYPNGNMAVMTDPGLYGQWFGTVTRYSRREQYSFSSNSDKGDQSIRIQFNDGGSANISGVVSWEMPLTPAKILQIHKEFRSQEGVDQQLVRPAIANAIFMSGPLMSSTESAGDRRAELLQFITDQAQNGIYKTARVQKQVVDPITGGDKSVTTGEIVTGADGKPVRENESALKVFGINMFPASINEIKYDPTVQAQINERQKQITEVQTAIAQAKKAEQQAITVAKQGEAAAAEAKWQQEVIKAKAVTEAEQEKEVATLNVQTAQLNKQKAQLEGEGEAAKRQAIMNADGGLEKKLDAYVRTQEIWANAFKDHQGPLVPSVVMGSNGASPNGLNSATALVDMLTAKTAKDLALETTIRGAEQTSQSGRQVKGN